MILAALLFVAGRGNIAALTGVAELRATLSRVLAGTEEIERSLRQQRCVFYDTHTQARQRRYKRALTFGLVEYRKSFIGKRI